MHPSHARGRHRKRTVPRTAVRRVALTIRPKAALGAIRSQEVRVSQPELPQQRRPVSEPFGCRGQDDARIVNDEVPLTMRRRICAECTPECTLRPCLSQVDALHRDAITELQPFPSRTTLEDLADEGVPPPQAGRLVESLISTRTQPISPELPRRLLRNADVRRASAIQRRISHLYGLRYTRTQIHIQQRGQSREQEQLGTYGSRQGPDAMLRVILVLLDEMV